MTYILTFSTKWFPSSWSFNLLVVHHLLRLVDKPNHAENYTASHLNRHQYSGKTGTWRNLFLCVGSSVSSEYYFFILEMEVRWPFERLLSMYETSHPFIRETCTFLTTQCLIFVAETPESVYEIDIRL